MSSVQRSIELYFRFLDGYQKELLHLIDRLHYEDGRQGTGYLKASVPVNDNQLLQELVDKSLEALGQNDRQSYDCYILKYPTGSFIPPHKDKGALFDAQHWRLNALIDYPHSGGELRIEDRPIFLAPADAMVFRPDDLIHSVSEITKGTRYIWSVGTML